MVTGLSSYNDASKAQVKGDEPYSLMCESTDSIGFFPESSPLSTPDDPPPLPLWRKVAYATGGLPMQMASNCVGFFLPIFLLETAKVAPFYLSLIQLMSRITDAVTDPFVGYLILLTKTRMGRKRPWLLFSAPIGFISFFFLFFTIQVESQISKFSYYCACIVLLQIGLTCFHVPYSSMTMALSDVPRERDSLTAYRMFAEVSSVLIGVAVFGGIMSPNRMANTCSDGGNATATRNLIAAAEAIHRTSAQKEVEAYMGASGAISIIYFISSLICFFGTRERPTNDERTSGYFSAVKSILTFRPYLIVMTSFLLMSLAIQFVQSNISLYITHSLKMSSMMIPGIMALLASSVILLPVCQFLMLKIGKQQTLALGMIVMIPALIATFFLPEQLSLYFYFPLMVYCGFSISVGFLLPWSMLPDVIDAFYIQHGFRKEAAFYSLYVFFNKLAVGVSLAASAGIMGFVGYDITKCSQPPTVGLALRYLIGPGAIVFLVAALICIYFYPLNKAKLTEIRAELLIRRQCNTKYLGVKNCETVSCELNDYQL